MYPISFDHPSPRSDGAPSVTDAAGTSRLLVVEWRHDDTWHVELCTDLSELDGTMDIVQRLRGSTGVEEVCLTLETSGAQGRESRREILRLMPEKMPVAEFQEQSLEAACMQNAVSDDDAMAVLSAALEVPDYDVNIFDFSDFIMAESAPEDCAVPTVVEPVAEAEQTDREAAHHLLSSIYGTHSGRVEGDNVIRVTVPQRPRDSADQINRLHPVMAEQGGVATKLLVVAGTIALLILGGALAELLAVDITTTANANVATPGAGSSISD